MKRPIYIKIPASQPHRTLEIYRRLLQLLLGASLFAGAFAGTFPFDFSIPPVGYFQAIANRWDGSWNPYDPQWIDRTQNIFFLMPIGFSSAGLAMLRARKSRWWIGLSVGLLSAGVCSVMIECSQALVSFRDPSFADVWCNTLGGGIGGVIFWSFGDKFLLTLATKLAKMDRWLTFRNRLILLILYAVAQLALPLMLHGSGELDGWDLSMPLLVGNEINADHRAWSGVVASVALADRAASSEQIANIAKGAKATDVLGQALVAAYELAGAGPYPDLSGHEKALVWAGAKSGASTPLGVVTSSDEWLKTSSNLFHAIARIRETSEFTLSTQAATLDTGQREIAPLRIVSISNGTSQRNLTFGQDTGDWVIRVRTAVASMPDLYLRDVLADSYAHALAVTAKNGVIVAYVDGAERGRCEITPEAKMIWRLYPRGTFRIYIDHFGYRNYAVIYRLLVMIPFAFLLSLALKPLMKPMREKRLIAVGAVLGMSVLIELVIWIQGSATPDVWNGLVSVLLGSVALISLLPRKKALTRAY